MGLTLVHPAHPDAPIADYPAPEGLHIPRARQCPMMIRPPSPGRARVPAQRLATAMTTGLSPQLLRLLPDALGGC
ncbi:MAG: hypothetical protein ACRDST_19465 [Pseudonocardiaceae bacterium]